MSEKCELCEQLEDEKCILHCEKDDWKDEKIILKFWEKISEKIDKINSVKDDYPEFEDEAEKNNFEFLKYEFNNVIFPNFIKNAQPFYELQREINLSFNQCYFKGDTDFRDLMKPSNITFNECHFYKDLKIVNQNFQNLFLFENCRVYEDATFQNIIFKGTSSFIDTIFDKNIKFIHSKFESLALFNNLKFNKLYLDNTFFKDETSFLNMKNEDGEKLTSSNIANRETARIIKYSFEKQANIIESNKFYALEMDKEEESLFWKENPKDKLIFKAHKIFSNHSQDWLLTLNWIIIFGFISALLSFFLMQNDDAKYIHFTIPIISLLLVFLGYFSLLILKINVTVFQTLPFLMYSLYISLTNDIFLNHFATTFNPFFIMKNGANITFPELLIKLIIAYLIYQFIISIRQNTRRQ